MLHALVDTHTHTIASTHAYSTLLENLSCAKKLGLEGIAVTDHTGSMPGSPIDSYFFNLPSLPFSVDGVRIILGAETNIVDYSGTLDLGERVLSRLEWVIASCHGNLLPSGTPPQHTAMYEAVLFNPYVNVIGHCGQEAFSFDYEYIVKQCRNQNKLIEINAHSFHGRPGSKKNCPIIAKLCMKHSVPIVVSSDAHFATQVGRFASALQILKEIHFPEELIVNRNLATLQPYLHPNIPGRGE